MEERPIRVTDDLTMLVIGSRNVVNDAAPPAIAGVHFARFEDLTPELLQDIAPDVVLSALVAPDFDAIDLARALVAAGFPGRYRAVTTPIPQPAAVVAEVVAHAAGVDFDLFVVTPETFAASSGAIPLRRAGGIKEFPDK